MAEISRRRLADDDWAPTVPCTRCGKPVRLFFNGGELDQQECCGVVYRTEIMAVDLVIADRK